MYSIDDIKKVLQKAEVKQRLVLPEGCEDKIQQVAKKLLDEKVATPILIFKTDKEVPKNLDKKIEIIVIEKYDKAIMKTKLIEVRKGKVDEAAADELLSQPNYFGAMLIEMELADGMLCGLSYTTADTLRPALQIIKTSEDYSLASSVFMMSKGDQRFIFTDCALNIKPDPKQLAEIAKMAGNFAISMNVAKPQVALLSYSTDGSGSGPDVDKVRGAVERMSKDSSIHFDFDGEIQFDAAFVKEVRTKKVKASKITKESADVYVFPDINAGNIGYKIAQRMGGFEAAGPFILGLNKPVNDLSRGATLNDIFNTAVVTALQAMNIKK